MIFWQALEHYFVTSFIKLYDMPQTLFITLQKHKQTKLLMSTQNYNTKKQHFNLPAIVWYDITWSCITGVIKRYYTENRWRHVIKRFSLTTFFLSQHHKQLYELQYKYLLFSRTRICPRAVNSLGCELSHKKIFISHSYPLCCLCEQNFTAICQKLWNYGSSSLHKICDTHPTNYMYSQTNQPCGDYHTSHSNFICQDLKRA